MKLAERLPLLVLLIFTTAQLSPASESDSVDRERMQSLIEALAGPDVQTREKAFNDLQKLGEMCWPSIAPFEHENSERGKLVKILGRDCAVFLPAHAATAESARKKLENSKDPDQRVEGFEDLMSHGSAGIRFLQKHLSGENATLGYSLKPQTPVLIGNGKVTTRIVLENHGKGVAWCQASILTPRMFLSKHEAYGQRRPGPVGTRGIGVSRRHFNSTGLDHHPIKDWIPILPGDTIPCKDFEVEINGVGIHILNAFGQVPEPAEIKARFRNSDADLLFTIGGQLSAESRYVRSNVNIFVLPNIKDYPEIGESMAISAHRTFIKAGANEVRAEVKVKLESKEKEALLWVEENFAKYAYYILLKDGEPVTWGSWHSVLSAGQDSELALKAQTLRPNQSVQWELLIARPAKAGRYTLHLVYEKPPTLENEAERRKEYLEQLPFQIMTTLEDVFKVE